MKRTLFLIIVLLAMQMQSQNAMVIPPVLNGPQYPLNLQNGTYEFFAGHQTATMGVNGNILGPTLIMNEGDAVNIEVTNNLGQPTTIHWHGMHVSASNDGGPHTIIQPGTTWNPQFTVMNRAGTYWYHPHLDEFTDEHVTKGIAGMIIVHDNDELNAGLPVTYGIDDFPVVIQTKDFDNNYQVVNHSNNDDILMVNATINPYLEVPAQVVRLRFLNGSSQRVFNFGLSGNTPFYLIATDGGLLEAPEQLTRLPLSPGERAEILLDLNGKENQTLYLISYASEFGNGIYGATNPGMSPNMTLNNYNPNLLNGNDFNILELRVVAQTANPVTSIPGQFSPINYMTENSADQQRSFSLSPVAMGLNQLNGDFTINGVSFDMNTINISIPLNNTEVWTVTNNSAIAHPFHVHDIQFQILSINGNTNIPAYARGWHDTFLVPAGGGSIKFITKFEDFADDSIPYMYHCHMLNHEDGGMMGAFTVVDIAKVEDQKMTKGITLFPNPSNGTYMTVKLHNQSEKVFSYIIIDELGRMFYQNNFPITERNNLISFPIDKLAPGNYILKVYSDKRIYSIKFFKS